MGNTMTDGDGCWFQRFRFGRQAAAPPHRDWTTLRARENGGLSLLLELSVPGIDWPFAERLAAETSRPGRLAVCGIPRRKWLRGKPILRISEVAEDGTEVFDEDAENDVAIAPSCREPLAQTLLLLGELLEPGWQLHVGWVGEGKQERDVSADQLAEIARHSWFDNEVHYRVV
jgi:hypothetical protein